MGPIGVFDSGYGGLTILSAIRKELPQYDYIYLGDNARAPYGPRSFEIVYEYTLEAVKELFDRGCELVILACNTASAKALRSIQQNDLPKIAANKRVLGVIRPSTEILGVFSKTHHVGILATEGTVKSNSYEIELEKYYPELTVHQYACPMWVPLIENHQHESQAGKEIIEADLKSLLAIDPRIDTILLACTHYPLVKKYLEQITPKNIQIIAQGEIVAKSLVDYLQRHQEIALELSKSGKIEFLTTENDADFNYKASQFYQENINAKSIKL